METAVYLVQPYAERACVRGDTDFSLTAHFDRWAETTDFVFGMDSNKTLHTQAEALEESVRVLVVRVHHNDIVGVEFKSGGVATLLVASMPKVALMADSAQAQPLSEGGSVIRAVVVDQNHLDDDLAIHLSDGLLKRLCRVVSRHDDNDPLAENHAVVASRSVTRDQTNAWIMTKCTM